MNGRSQLALVLSSALAGFAWGIVRHRGHRQARPLALLQAVEWFVAAGGAAWIIEHARDALEGLSDPDERITHLRRVASEHDEIGA